MTFVMVMEDVGTMQVETWGEKGLDILRAYALEWERLCEVALCTYQPGERLLRQGEEVSSLFLVADGTIQVEMLAENGRDLTLCCYVDGGILGDVEFVQGERTASTTLRAVRRTQCIRIPLAANQTYLGGNLAFLHKVARGLAQKLVGSSQAHLTSAVYSSQARLCTYVLRMEHNGMFTEILADVARATGMSYRHLLRLMGVLCQQRVLEKTPAGYLIQNRDYLLEKSELRN